MSKIEESTKQWAADRFGIKPEEIAWYHSGTCYDRIGVTTEEAAKTVQAAVKGRYVNGGWFGGMEKGGFTKGPDGIFDVTV